MVKEEKIKKPENEKVELGESEKQEKSIVIEETEDDVLITEIKGDPDDFKEEVKKEAEKGRFMRVLIPILFFLVMGGLIGFATWYYNDQNKLEEPKKLEEKIQTPPEVIEEVPTEAPVADELPAETPTPSPAPTTTSGFTEYTVKEGDTMSGIANAHDMTSTELATYNNITDAESLQIGQKLKIPNK